MAIPQPMIVAREIKSYKQKAAAVQPHSWVKRGWKGEE